jgi:hypothetical protein
VTALIDAARHPIGDRAFVASCRTKLETSGALVLQGFLRADVVARIIAESAPRERDVFYAQSTHNVFLTDIDSRLPLDHPHNRQVASSKGLIADDQIPAASPLREVYDDASFRGFLCELLDIEEIHPYADDLSSINVHFASAGRELGWHFDNSSFAVTLLLQAPEAGGVFEYVPNVRDADIGDMAYERVAAVLDGDEDVTRLSFDPGDLVLFRGRNALHRVTPTIGPITRMLVVFAYNDQPGIGLSASALTTFYGRTA